ncbi:leucyl aminopeptidase [Aestuariicella hydrocarbonica]|uniref:Probable cytosol aminopeptidase n=1 Tax=Pseudomaricurvus hydrocarbonicus TaxID=1470433 RepID=A0A9E5JRI4_9GAMM|nr:leucyl aminopeptidase [Aestuariicella hydrocarbonica]NHO65204.1 leucyl aminopeptidase [Aestuariicella hydrocarbonica]
MEFQAKTTAPLTQRTACLVLPIYEDGKLPGATSEVNKASGGLIAKLAKQGDIKGGVGTAYTLFSLNGCSAERVVLIGFGKHKAPLTPEKFDKAILKAAAAVKATAAKDVCVDVSEVAVEGRDEDWKARQCAKLMTNSLYQFSQLKSKKAPLLPLKKGVYSVSAKSQVTAINKALKTGQATARGMALTKDLGNLPGNVCTPTYLTGEAKKLAKGNSKLTAKALNEKQMRELKMGSLLSVSAGSDEEAQLIILEYKGGKKDAKPVVLVGKGITFDTGGISLKPGAGMDEMKYDMGGAASVLGTMKAITEMELKLNVVAIIAAAENMPSGAATKPGDIVTSMSGQTIEILNTDAEGRLVLCDALTYAERYKPKAVVDIATLTGACVVALGKHASGLYSNNDALAAELLEAGQQAGDRAWHMPLWDEYQQQLDSNFADIANIGSPGGGSITAACFLSRFTKAYDWAHLDIAGTAWDSGSAKGATGRPVSLLVEYLQRQAS